MDNNKLNTITNLFEGKEIRSIWNSEREDYFFSVVDVISVLTDSNEPRKYWSVLKTRLKKEGSQLTTNCSQLKLKSNDGKYYNQDVLDTKGILRLIESIPSKKAEPFKLWLAQMGKERIDDDKWIKQRLNGIIDRHKLTDVWKESGITKNYEYGILTNEIYRQWSGMKASQYKEYKGLRKESLRDNMTDIEVTLANLGEIATRELVKEHKPYGLKENREMAKRGGKIAKNTRNNLEKELGKSVISKGNSLNYKYIDEKKLNTTAELNNKHPEKPK